MSERALATNHHAIGLLSSAVGHTLSSRAFVFICSYYLRLPIFSSPSRTLLRVQVTTTMTTVPMNSTPSSSSNFQAIFVTAVKAYENRTKKDLLAHPLASQLQACDSPTSILAVLQGQVNDLNQVRESDERLTKWLGPTVNVLLSFSATIGGGVGLVSMKFSRREYNVTVTT